MRSRSTLVGSKPGSKADTCSLCHACASSSVWQSAMSCHREISGTHRTLLVLGFTSAEWTETVAE
eukprot:scaffold23436_cov68-Phaeocystis_antarctica.AAC.7